jgi:hypothetical protein
VSFAGTELAEAGRGFMVRPHADAADAAQEGAVTSGQAAAARVLVRLRELQQPAPSCAANGGERRSRWELAAAACVVLAVYAFNKWK